MVKESAGWMIYVRKHPAMKEGAAQKDLKQGQAQCKLCGLTLANAAPIRFAFRPIRRTVMHRCIAADTSMRTYIRSCGADTKCAVVVGLVESVRPLQSTLVKTRPDVGPPSRRGLWPHGKRW